MRLRPFACSPCEAKRVLTQAALLACMISHPEVMTETDVFVMRSVTSFSGQLNKRVAFTPSCASFPAFRMPPKCLPDHSPARYDVSGVPTECIQEVIEKDWNHLLRENLGDDYNGDGDGNVAVTTTGSNREACHPPSALAPYCVADPRTSTMTGHISGTEYQGLHAPGIDNKDDGDGDGDDTCGGH